jgi:hypothetical protein
MSFGPRIAVLLLLLVGCNDSGDGNPDGGANVCNPSFDFCFRSFTCPVGEYCYVPLNEVPLCGAAPPDGGSPPCPAPECSKTVPFGCTLVNGHVACRCE